MNSLKKMATLINIERQIEQLESLETLTPAQELKLNQLKASKDDIDK